MEPISILEFGNLLVGIALNAWRLYCAWKRGAAAQEIARLHQELDQSIAILKNATTPKELQDAARATAQSHNDILG